MEARPDSPPPEPVRKSALPFFAVALALYALPGAAAQASSAVLGLAWSEVFAFLLPAAVFAAGSNLRPATFLLLARRPSAAQVVLGLLCGAAGFVAAGSLMALTALLLPQSWLEAFDLGRLFKGPLLERVSLGVLASTLAPLCEEAAFRGYVQNALLSRLRPGAAIAASSFLFAAMHLDPVRFVAVFALGLLFGWLAWRSGSLWPSVAAHAANNGIASLLTVSGLAELGPETANPRAALLTLVIAGFPLLLLASAYRFATQRPPPVEEAMVRRDPADVSASFRPGRIPPPLAAAAALGIALLALIEALGRGPKP